MSLSTSSVVFLSLLSLASSTSTNDARAAEFEIPPGGLQLVEFESEAPVENIRGISTEARGTLRFDPARPAAATGKVTVPVASLRTGNTKRDTDLQSAGFLDAGAHPELSFAIDEVALELDGPLKPGVSTRGRVTGKLTIRGKTRPTEVAVKLAYVEASDKLKKVYIPGNALRIKGEFEVVLADFGVEPPPHLLGVKIAEKVSIRFALTALEK